MAYRKVLAWIVVDGEDEDVATQHLNDALDALGEQVTVFDSGFTVDDAGEPQNATEIRRSAS